MSAIFLIGMPGAGKTYWGKKIGEGYQLPFLDMDSYIERATQQSIAEIFTKDGETYFRELETQVLKNVIEQHPAPIVIACGGGTPVFNDNMNFMRQNGCTVYLQASIETLVSRLATQEASRPLLKDTAMEEMLQFLYSQRKEVYEQASYILQAEDISITNFAQIISSCTKEP